MTRANIIKNGIVRTLYKYYCASINKPSVFNSTPKNVFRQIHQLNKNYSNILNEIEILEQQTQKIYGVKINNGYLVTPSSKLKEFLSIDKYCNSKIALKYITTALNLHIKTNNLQKNNKIILDEKLKNLLYLTNSKKTIDYLELHNKLIDHYK